MRKTDKTEESYRMEALSKVIKAKDRELLEFLVIDKLYCIAKLTNWKTASEQLILATSQNEQK